MNAFGRQVAIIMLLTAPVAIADDNPVPSKPAFVDIVYLHRSRPIFLRLRIEVDGVPFERRWKEHVASLFQELDTNGDGSLDLAELTEAASDADTQRSPEAARIARRAARWSARRNPFNAFSIEEFTAFLMSRRLGPLQMADTSQIAAGGSQVGAKLFASLDGDGDEKLSSAELQHAATELRRRDLDDDGAFSVAELSENPTPYFVRAEPQMMEAEQPFIDLTLSSAPIAVLREFERRYAKAPSVAADGRATLSRELGARELGLSSETFGTYDLDSDGMLDRDELRELLRRPPVSLELIVRLGSRREVEFVVETAPGATADGTPLRRSEDGLASLVIDDVQVEIAESAAAVPTLPASISSDCSPRQIRTTTDTWKRTKQRVAVISHSHLTSSIRTATERSSVKNWLP
ncbi:MAG: hypothetical protein R3C19_23285 [Planctomycetaceae bacterium]